MLQEGVFYFGTVSDSRDYLPSETMIELLKKKFNRCHSVVESGSSGKKHFHFVGNSTVRMDNLKRSIKTLLENEGLEVGLYTLDFRTEPNPRWRIGYLLKEKDAWFPYTTFEQDELDTCASTYEERPKVPRAKKEDQVMTLRKLEEYFEEHFITDRQGVRAALDDLRNSGQMSLSFYCKLNIKRIINFVERNYCDD